MMNSNDLPTEFFTLYLVQIAPDSNHDCRFHGVLAHRSHLQISPR